MLSASRCSTSPVCKYILNLKSLFSFGGIFCSFKYTAIYSELNERTDIPNQKLEKSLTGFSEEKPFSQRWWRMPEFPALGR